ncbi:D-alanyl-D-alanine carboxypeptidase [Peribacillus deserti]|uniref:D-alanyl-D-alanine carboxypeptidase n=1 Tax=Peribacillus deserti TaxID=673318 RepID=A0ABS2QMN3_9BACI|nr:M15 family metallopeptidase [Peribacillus deserti]MBM7694431.1 D-alanyl-D-alanine carboxypeptidase [Peribacillus deserti]
MQKSFPLAAILLTTSILTGCGTQEHQTNQANLSKAESTANQKETIDSVDLKESKKSDAETKVKPDDTDADKSAEQVPARTAESKPAVISNTISKKVEEPTEAKPHAANEKPKTESPEVKKPVNVPVQKKPSAPKSDREKAIPVVAQPSAITVMVNKENKLPDGYVPRDLVYTSIPFIFQEKLEKTKMRKEASDAISRLFASAKAEGVELLGVSAYRSFVTQTALYNSYVQKDGYEKARTYSAVPGTSEHQTGLSIDVTGGNGACPAESCFGNTKEAKWLEAHASEYGFIIRYPNGKSSITGYKYEPWHLRYIGTSAAKDIMSQKITLEEYMNAVPVNN